MPLFQVLKHLAATAQALPTKTSQAVQRLFMATTYCHQTLVTKPEGSFKVKTAILSPSIQIKARQLEVDRKNLNSIMASAMLKLSGKTS